MAAPRPRRKGRSGAEIAQLGLAGGYAAELVVRGGPAPARQIDRGLALPQGECLLESLLEIGLHALARHLAAQEIRPKKFAERRGILGEAADAPQFAGEAAERVVLELSDRSRKILEVPAFPLGVVWIDPSLVIHHTPES